MGREFRAGGKVVLAARPRLRHGLQCPLQPRGQHRQPHDFDQPDVLFFDVVDFRVGVEDAQGVFLAGAVVAENKVQLVVPASPPGDGGDGIVRLAITFGQHAHRGIAPAAPLLQHAAGQTDKRLRVGRREPEGGQGPLHPSCLHVGGKGVFLLNGGFFHRKDVPAALIVVVRENGASHDGQVGV